MLILNDYNLYQLMFYFNVTFIAFLDNIFSSFFMLLYCCLILFLFILKIILKIFRIFYVWIFLLHLILSISINYLLLVKDLNILLSLFLSHHRLASNILDVVLAITSHLHLSNKNHLTLLLCSCGLFYPSNFKLFFELMDLVRCPRNQRLSLNIGLIHWWASNLFRHLRGGLNLITSFEEEVINLKDDLVIQQLHHLSLKHYWGFVLTFGALKYTINALNGVKLKTYRPFQKHLPLKMNFVRK